MACASLISKGVCNLTAVKARNHPPPRFLDAGFAEYFPTAAYLLGITSHKVADDTNKVIRGHDKLKIHARHVSCHHLLLVFVLDVNHTLQFKTLRCYLSFCSHSHLKMSRTGGGASPHSRPSPAHGARRYPARASSSSGELACQSSGVAIPTNSEPGN